MKQPRNPEIISISFDRAYYILEAKGPARITKGTGTEYIIEAYTMTSSKLPAVPVIRVKPRSGFTYIRYAYIHADCWGDDVTCQGSRVEDIYKGKQNIYTWLEENSKGDPDTYPEKEITSFL